MSANAIRMGKAFVEIFGDLDPLSRTLKLGESKLKGFGEKISAIGERLAKAGGAVIGVEGIVGLLEKLQGASESGAALTRLSQQTGVSVEALGELGHAAEEAGLDLDHVTTSIGRMQKFLVEAAHGSKEGHQALAMLGVTISELARLSPDRQFERIGLALAKIRDPAIRDALAMQLFGKSGQEALPIFARGAGWLRKMRDEAVELGRKTKEEAAASFEFTRAIDSLWKAINRVTSSLAGALVPNVQDLAKKMQSGATVLSAWIKAHKDWIVAGAKGAGIALALGAGILLLGTAVTHVAAGFGGMAAAATFGMGIVATVIAAVLSPIGLLTAGVVALALYFGTSTGAIGASVEWLSGVFFQLQADFDVAWKGITAALKAGNLANAMKVAGALLKLEWGRAVGFLETKWIEFKYAALDVALELASGFAGALIEAFGQIEKMWNALEARLTAGAIKVYAMFEKKGALSPAESGAIDIATGLARGAADARTDAWTGQAKSMAGQAIAGLRLIAPGAKQGELDGVEDRLRGLTDDLARASRAAEDEAKQPSKGAANLPTTDHLSSLAHSTEKGIGSEDVRTREGFKSVAAALRQGRGDPASEAAKTLAQMKTNQDRQVRYDRDIRNTLVNGFKTVSFPG